MAYLIQRIKSELEESGFESRTNDARDWLLSKVASLNANRAALLQDGNLKDKSMIGRMYFYFYDPKTKDMLPYYDRFPLVIPIERYQDGFLGLNLHYISPRQRVILLDKLSHYLNNHKYDETTRIRLSYDHLRNASTIYECIPCVKKYLYKQVKSRFLEITADEWDIAALLPTEYFSGASKNKVFSDSRKKF
jgi:hypothetical protein